MAGKRKHVSSEEQQSGPELERLPADGYVGVKVGVPASSSTSCVLAKNSFFRRFSYRSRLPLLRDPVSPPSGLVFIFCLFSISLQSPLNFIVWSVFLLQLDTGDIYD